MLHTGKRSVGRHQRLFAAASILRVPESCICQHIWIMQKKVLNIYIYIFSPSKRMKIAHQRCHNVEFLIPIDSK